MLVSKGIEDGGLGGGVAAPWFLGKWAIFGHKRLFFGQSWHAQKLLICPKIAELPKHFSGNLFQLSQFNALHYA